MSVVDRNVIDIISIEGDESSKRIVLYISDHVNWDLETIGGHLSILQDKINDNQILLLTKFSYYEKIYSKHVAGGSNDAVCNARR